MHHFLRVLSTACTTMWLMRVVPGAEKEDSSGGVGVSFSAELGAKNGAQSGEYFFQLVQTKKTSGSYTDIMVEECDKIGMKPLCEHPSYCKNNAQSIYIGQTNHIAHGGHKNTDSYFPSGWSAVKGKFPTNFCTFTVNHGGHDKALCINGGGHHWRTPGQDNNIMCASRTKPGPPSESLLTMLEDAF